MRITTLEDLQSDLKNLEIEWDMYTSSERRQNQKYYDRQKQFLTDSIIDKLTGPTKRRLREMIEPHTYRVKPSEWNGFLIKLRDCRSVAEIEKLHHHWKEKLSFKQITQLPDLNIAA